MQLVLSNNRVIAHGENFLATGGTVINTVTGVKYENATIAECEGCPSDIDSVGYEYHAGQFIPCAPYGKGSGNLAVLCDRDGKVIKDSGIPMSEVLKLQLLWKNASPSSTFGAQTITLASDDYKWLYILSKDIYNANEKTFTMICETGSLVSGGGLSKYRSVSTNGAKVTFGVSSAPYISTSTRNVESVNVITSVSIQRDSSSNYIIPIAIYGVKL